MPSKPKKLRGEMSKAWDYIATRGGCCKAAEFDEDFAPIGPKLRYDLFSFGVQSSTSGKTTIIFFG